MLVCCGRVPVFAFHSPVLLHVTRLQTARECHELCLCARVIVCRVGAGLTPIARIEIGDGLHSMRIYNILEINNFLQTVISSESKHKV